MVTVRNSNLHQWVFIVVIILPKCKQKRNENSGGILLHNARKLHLISSSYSYAHSDVIHLGGKFHQRFVSICIGEDLPWKDQYVFSITEWFSEWFEVVNKVDVWAYAWNPLIFCDLETCQANNSRYFRILANIYIYIYITIRFVRLPELLKTDSFAEVIIKSLLPWFVHWNFLTPSRFSKEKPQGKKTH